MEVFGIVMFGCLIGLGVWSYLRARRRRLDDREV